jgi:Ca-activated chloride channel family protein
MEETMKKALFILVVIVGLITTVMAQKEETGSIGGVVKSSKHSVLQGAKIVLTLSNVYIAETSTDAGGEYRFDGLRPGRYQLNFSADDHLPGEKRITVYARKHSLCNVTLTLMEQASIEGDSGASTRGTAVAQQPSFSTIAESGMRSDIASVSNSFSSVRRKLGSGSGFSPSGTGAAGGGSFINNNSPHIHAIRQYDDNQDYYRGVTAYDSSEYSKISEGGFQNPINRALSTFSIDVDTAYYAQMRSALQDRRNLPPNSVRIEELINYFSYDYPEPKQGEVFSVYTELGECPWNDERFLLHIGLKGKEIDLSKAPPTNLVFLVDVSGSMNQHNKLPLVKRSLNILVDRMRPQDTISMVVYAGHSRLVFSGLKAANRAEIRSAINTLSAGGSTAGEAGLTMAYQAAKKHFIKGGSNRVILCTDGDFNVGVSNDEELANIAAGHARDGIFLTILGFGMGNYKDSKMETISNKANGNYAYLDDINEAHKVLAEEINGTLFAIAKDVKIQVEFNPVKVKSYRLIGYVNRMLEAQDFKDDKKDAGELGSGHTVTAIYEIIPADSEEDLDFLNELKYQNTSIKGSDEVATVKLRYKKPDADTSIPKEYVVADQARSIKNCSNDFRFSAAVAGFGMLASESEYIQGIRISELRSLAESGLEARDTAKRQEFLELLDIFAGFSKPQHNGNYWD